MTFIEAAKFALEENDNIPMSSTEIWDKVKDLVDTKGKTPWASMTTKILGQCVDTPAKSITGVNRGIFKIIGSNPMKYQLVKYVPKHIKESFIESGFITKDILKEILAKNNINIEI